MSNFSHGTNKPAGDQILTGDQNFIMQAERDLAKAHVDMDLAKIDELLHPEYTILQPDGRVENKTAVLHSYQDGQRSWDLASARDLTVTIFDNLALVSGTWTANGRNGHTSFDYAARFLSMWRKDNGRWQNIAYQSTEIDAGEEK